MEEAQTPAQEQKDSATAPRRQWSIADKASLAVLCVGLTTGSASPWLAQSWHGFEMASHFQAQYLAITLLLVMYHVIRRRWHGLLAFIAPLALGVWHIAPLYWPIHDTPSITEQTPTLKVMCFNMHYINRRQDDVIAYIRQMDDHDAIVLFELPTGFIDQLKRSDLPFRIYYENASRFDVSGLALLLKEPNAARNMRFVKPSWVPGVVVDLPLGDQSVACMFMHPAPPISPESTEWRNREFVAHGDWARQQRHCLLMGDFNCTPFSSTFKDLLERSKLENSQRGYGLTPTWPMGEWFLAPMQIAIDHCLHSPNLRVLDRFTGPPVGSDHRPLHVELAFAKSD